MQKRLRTNQHMPNTTDLYAETQILKEVTKMSAEDKQLLTT